MEKIVPVPGSTFIVYWPCYGTCTSTLLADNQYSSMFTARIDFVPTVLEYYRWETLRAKSVSFAPEFQILPGVFQYDDK